MRLFSLTDINNFSKKYIQNVCQNFKQSDSDLSWIDTSDPISLMLK